MNVGLLSRATNDVGLSLDRLAVRVTNDLLVFVFLDRSVHDVNLVSHGFEETANQLFLLDRVIVGEVLVGVLREGCDIVTLLSLSRKGSRESEVVVDVTNLATKILRDEGVVESRLKDLLLLC